MRCLRFVVGILVVSTIGAAAVSTQDPARFSGSQPGGPLPGGWTHLELRGVDRPTRWTLVEDQGSVVLNGSSDAGASLVFTAVDYDPVSTPIVRWRWKVAATVAEGDLAERKLDDAAARVYVGFKWDPSLEGPWRSLVGPWQRLKYLVARKRLGEMPPFAALVYVWAHGEPIGWTGSNPSFERSIQVVVRSKEDSVGLWQSESRDVAADFRAWFGFDPPPISHVAFLVDADDTGGEAQAWFGDVSFHPAKGGPAAASHLQLDTR